MATLPRTRKLGAGAVGAVVVRRPRQPTVFFDDSIHWMAEAGITQGFDDGTFRPTEEVSPQVMAAFLCRLTLV